MPDVRAEFVTEAATQTVEGMGEMGLSPQEGLIAGELILWTLFQNTMKGARTDELQRQAKLVCTRALNRLISRVEAWPADTTQRQ